MESRVVGFLTQPKQSQPQPPIYPFVFKPSEKPKFRQFILIDHDFLSPNKSSNSENSGQQKYQNQSFQSYSYNNEDEPIQQQKILPIVSELHRHSQVKNNQFQSESQQTDQLWNLSENYLRQANSHLVFLKEQYRKIMAKLRHNNAVLQRQQSELSVLRSIKQKALDYNYELQMSQEYSKKRVYSTEVASNVRKQLTFVKKKKYQQLKEEQQLNDPNTPECILSNSRILDSKASGLVRLVCKREQILNQKRQFQKRQQYLGELRKKQNHYLTLIDQLDHIISKQSIYGLKQRVQVIKDQIKLKKTIFSSQMVEIDLQLISLRSDLEKIQVKTNSINKQILNCQYLERPKEERTNQTALKKASGFVRHKRKSTFLLNQLDQSKLNDIKTPRLKMLGSDVLTPIAGQRKYFKRNIKGENQRKVITQM